MSVLRRRLTFTALALVGSWSAAVAGDNDAPTVMAPYIAAQIQTHLPDGRLYNLVCMGEGRPIAVLDVGLGDRSISWARLQPELAKITRICIPDRAGYGFSAAGPLPRDSNAETRDLEDALRAARLPPPYVVMGHSLGGLNARLFAYRNREKLAGLLLIDPSVSFKPFGAPDEYAAKMHFSFYESCAAQARAGTLIAGQSHKGDPGPCVPSPDRRWTPEEVAGVIKVRSEASVFETTLSELRSAYDTDVDEVAAARRTLGSVPLIILTEDAAHFRELKPWFASDVDAVYAGWVAGHQDEARDSTRGEDRIVNGAGHDIEADRPDEIISAFREIVEAARRSDARIRPHPDSP